MRQAKKVFIIGIVFVLFFAQIPGWAADPSGSLVNPMEGITQNEPQSIFSEEVPFEELANGSNKLVKSKKTWIAVGAVIVTGIVLGLAGGGDDGGDSSEPVEPASETGQVSFNW